MRLLHAPLLVSRIFDYSSFEKMASTRHDYSFTLSEMHVSLPALNVNFRIGGIWPAVLAIGSVAFYCVLFFFVWPSAFSDAIMNRKTKLKAGDKGRSSDRNSSFAHGHFVALFVYSTVCWVSTLVHIAYEGQLSSFDEFMCAPVSNNIRVLSLSFIVSKVWEWGDTMIHFSKGQDGREIGFLHSYHHATTFFLFLLVTNFPGTEKCGMLLNGFVHSLMYYHFAFRLPAWARPLITATQIAQLVFVTMIWHWTPGTCGGLSAWPKMYPVEFILPYFMVPVYAIFFVKFFVESYFFRSRSSSSRKSS